MNLQNRADYGESNTPTSNELTLYSQTCNNKKDVTDNEDDDDDE